MSAVFDRLDFVNGHVDLAMGSGGRASALLIEQLFYPAFDNPILRQGNDQAVVLGGRGRMALSTDCHVVSPLFFPGVDIGSVDADDINFVQTEMAKIVADNGQTTK